jgi:G6PDH family F420-dependent oxidoreductase
MVTLGYALSSEEHPPRELVRQARRAEEAGFPFALISDHFHPWVDRQGHAPMVWGVIGAIAAATERLHLGTGVTCPIIRTHPAFVAHAAATAACLMPGRFFLGVGTGENLNEHVTGDRWPAPAERVEMLEEAVEIIRLLWRGGFQSHRGRHYTLDRARLYTLPDEPPPLKVAAGSPVAAELAGRIGDGFISTAPRAELVERFAAAGGDGARIGQMTVCWAETEEAARRTAHEWWPNVALRGDLSQELATPEHFEMAAANVREEDVAGAITCGPDPEKHLEMIRAYDEAGFTHVYVHQVGPDQDGFFRFYEREVLPRVTEQALTATG